MDVKKVATDKKRMYNIKDDKQDFHSKDGMIKKEDFSKGKVKTNTGKEFFVFPASRKDQFVNLKRGAQIMDPKDLGFILSNSLVDKNSIVFDCGAGSGASACFFATYVKKVYSFDVREDHIAIVEENAKRLDLTNVKVALKDIYSDDLGVKDNCDLFVLDVPEPEKAIANIDKNLKVGGFLAAYNPCITQINNILNELPENYMIMKTVEVIERQWHAEGRKVRPKTKEFSHSGFISIIRKVGE